MTTVAVALALALSTGAVPVPLPRVPYTSFKLPNGLNVILSEDHTAPIVGVEVRYDVGSKDEKPGRTGFAHLFEHLMFEGSLHLPKGEADRLIEDVGGTSNGSTGQDQTVYWEQVPATALELVLFIEADRMGYLLPTLDQAKLDNQREVVLNERRQSYEMRPYGLAYLTLSEKLWDPDFPYHWLPIGAARDVEAASLDDVRDFFRRWYGPNNASLAIAGDFDPGQARVLVEKWFGAIPPSPAEGGPLHPVHAAPVPRPSSGERRVTLEDDVELSRLYLAWPTPKEYAPGDAALDLLASILADGKSARLVKRLVMEDRVAQNVSASEDSQRLGSMFVITATAKPGEGLDSLLTVIDGELARLAAEPPTAVELERAVNKAEAAAIFGLEPVGGFGGRAASLNHYYFETGDPGFFVRDVGRYRALAPDDVRRVAATYLKPEARVVLSVVPRESSEAPAGRMSRAPKRGEVGRAP
jgi:zinc protease